MAKTRYTAGIGITPSVRIHMRGERTVDLIRDAVRETVDEVAEVGHDTATALAPEGMKKHIQARTTTSTARVVADHKMAKGFEEGMRPHVITTRRKKALAGEDFGPVRGPVTHPGTPPQPYLRPAHKLMNSVWEGILRAKLFARGLTR